MNLAIYKIFYKGYDIKAEQTGAELMKGIDIYIPVEPGSDKL